MESLSSLQFGSISTAFSLDLILLELHVYIYTSAGIIADSQISISIAFSVYTFRETIYNMSSLSYPVTTAQTTPCPELYPDFESKWQALITRDQRAAKCFLYCVKSTGIFCRPICAARLARRKNVVFYDTVLEAEQAGFRPCKRCKPMLPLNESHHSIIRQTCKLLDQSPKSAPHLKVLADNAGLTQWHFHRIFRRFTGITPRMYWEARHSPGKQMKKKLRNIDMKALITKIAKLDENTFIDHELINSSYPKSKKQAEKEAKLTPAAIVVEEPKNDCQPEIQHSDNGLWSCNDADLESPLSIAYPGVYSPLVPDHADNEIFPGSLIQDAPESNPFDVNSYFPDLLLDDVGNANSIDTLNVGSIETSPASSDLYSENLALAFEDLENMASANDHMFPEQDANSAHLFPKPDFLKLSHQDSSIDLERMRVVVPEFLY